MNEEKHIVIIGGGISGLSAAWELENDFDLRPRYTLLEADSRWGGKIETRVIPGPAGGRFILDGGAESIISRKPDAWALAGELGLADRIRDPGSETRGMYVLDRGVLRRIPLNPIAFLRSPLMSLPGKLRILAEPFVPPRRDGKDESLADFASRRLGEEAMRKFIAPILAGIYSADPDRQSILTTSPIMREMEAQAGSLFGALLKRMAAARRSRNGASSKPRFFTFKKGAGELVTRLVESLSGELLLDATVEDLTQEDQRCMLHLRDGRRITADAVLIAAPANVAANLLERIAPGAASALSRIRHTSIGSAFLVYRRSDLRLAEPVSGLMIPRREGRRIDAVTFPFNKMPERAPVGFTAIRVFFGGADANMVSLPEDELQKAIGSELAELLGIQAAPIGMEVFRWADSFPQADVGHLDLVARIKGLLPAGIYLAGGSYTANGVPDCVRQGRATARQILADLRSPASGDKKKSELAPAAFAGVS